MKGLAIVTVLALAVILAGCIGMPDGSDGGANESGTGGGREGAQDAGSGGSPSANGEDALETSGASGGSDETENPEPETSGGTAGRPAGKTDVLMLGRSVAYGWAEHMGLQWQEDESYVGEYDGKTFRYLHMDYPPDIDDSAVRAMEKYDYDIVFFKLCFVDFGNEYGDMLQDGKQYIQNVYNEAVVKRKKRLIVGNALPQVSRDTTGGLKQNHQEYNRWLNDFASSHEGIYVLDLHGTLADSSGALKAQYASSYDDSHPNSAGYAAITPGFMDKVDEAMGG